MILTDRIHFSDFQSILQYYCFFELYLLSCNENLKLLHHRMDVATVTSFTALCINLFRNASSASLGDL